MEERVKKYFENPRKIVDVKPTANYTLLITFDNGEIKKVLIKIGNFILKEYHINPCHNLPLFS